VFSELPLIFAAETSVLKLKLKKQQREKKENKDRKDDMGERCVISNEIISRT